MFLICFSCFSCASCASIVYATEVNTNGYSNFCAVFLYREGFMPCFPAVFQYSIKIFKRFVVRAWAWRTWLCCIAGPYSTLRPVCGSVRILHLSNGVGEDLYISPLPLSLFFRVAGVVVSEMSEISAPRFP